MGSPAWGSSLLCRGEPSAWHVQALREPARVVSILESAPAEMVSSASKGDASAILSLTIGNPCQDPVLMVVLRMAAAHSSSASQALAVLSVEKEAAAATART